MEGDNDEPGIFDAKKRVREASHSLLSNDNESETIDIKRQKLIKKVQENFDSEENMHDLAILYEITGYQGEAPASQEDFWAYYTDLKVRTFS